MNIFVVKMNDSWHYKYFDGSSVIEEMIKLLDEDRENKIRKFIKLGYDSKLIYSVVNNLYKCSVKEFMQRFKIVKTEELKTKILYEKYSSLCAISDILDAIYKGRLSDGLLKTKDNIFC